MYNYDFNKNDENVLYEGLNKCVEIGNDNFIFNILVTNKNILFFENINKNNVLNSRGMYMPAEYELKIQIALDNLKFKIFKEDIVYTEIVHENNNIIINDFELII